MIGQPVSAAAAAAAAASPTWTTSSTTAASASTAAASPAIVIQTSAAAAAASSAAAAAASAAAAAAAFSSAPSHSVFAAASSAFHAIPAPPSISIMPSAASVAAESGIKDVWTHNMEEAFHDIRRLVQKYQYVAMDTEFPGVVARPIGEFRSASDYQHQLLRCNVDMLKIIQLGLTFMDENGKSPSTFTYQFNFKFSLNEDMYAQDSIDLLQKSGIQFHKHEEQGICVREFAESLMTSGLVLSDQVKWLSFHSGYDFGYLLRLLTDVDLPEDEEEFFQLLRLFFPLIYDVKYIMKSCKNLKGGLQEVADQLELERIGPQHQAGSDSLLTGAAFFKMRQLFFENDLDDDKYCGQLYGLGAAYHPVVLRDPATPATTSSSAAAT